MTAGAATVDAGAALPLPMFISNISADNKSIVAAGTGFTTADAETAAGAREPADALTCDEDTGARTGSAAGAGVPARPANKL